MYADTTPRNWKWMLPAMLAVVLLVAASYVMAMGYEGLAYIAGGFSLIFLISALLNNVAYFRHLAVDDLERKRLALATTPDQLTLQYARGMHPDTFKMIIGRRDVAWMLKHSPVPDERRPYCVLFAAPQVTEMFVSYFLLNSNPQQGLSKRRLSEGSYRFDPTKVATDYDQWDAFTSLLQGEGMLTDPNGNQTGLWIPPWDPKTCAKAFGMEYIFDDEEESGK